jgi:hypothetical protein
MSSFRRRSMRFTVRAWVGIELVENRTDLAFPPGFALVVQVNATVRQKLSEARGRLVWNQFLHASGGALFAGLAGAVAWRIFDRPGWQNALPWLVGISLLAALGAAVARWRSLVDVAREVDARLGTKDRFLTELQTTEPTAWADAMHREVETYAANLRLGERLRLPGPGVRFLWLLLPLVALGVLEGLHHVRLAGKQEELAAAREILQKTRDAAPPDDKELAKAAEELADVEKRLPETKEPLREALRALAELERKLASASSGDALSPAETAALADAVAAEAPQLAGELRSGDAQGAADSVAKLDPAALAKALEQAAQHLENRRLEELARDRNAQQQLGSILRSSSGEGTGQRKKFLSALRDIKQGNSGRNEKDGQNNSGEGEPSDAPNGGEKPDAGLADNAPPGGRPGSDRDLGKGSDLGSQKDPESGDDRPEEFVSGQMGDGASLVEMLRAAGGDDPQARRAWKSAWQTAAPAALDAVAREEIPPGSRLMVKRYFEAIRPKE